MKRFYKEVAVSPVDAGFTVLLDGRTVRTPVKATLVVPTRGLAEALAEEWRAQRQEVLPADMRLTRLANTAIDHVSPRRGEVIGEIAGYAETDLVCYRAAEPDELVSRQVALWQPVIDWAGERLGVAFAVTSSILPEPQAPEAAEAVRAHAGSLGDFPLTGLHAATAALGSVLLGLALAEGRIAADAAFEAAHVDELYQAELWGDDREAAARRESIRADIRAAARLLELADG